MRERKNRIVKRGEVKNMTVRELKKKLGITTGRALALVNMPDFPAIKIGEPGKRRQWVINGDLVDRWFAEEVERQKARREEYVQPQEPLAVRAAMGDWSKKHRYEDREKRLKGVI